VAFQGQGGGLPSEVLTSLPQAPVASRI